MEESELKDCSTYCSQCSEDITDQYSFQDSIYKQVIEWLCHHTCIDWFAYGRGTKKPCSIYGTVFISNQENITRKTEILVKYKRGSGDKLECKYCKEVSNDVQLTIELNIFQYEERLSDCGDTYEFKEKLSPEDILQQVDDLLYLENLKDTDMQRMINISSGFDYTNNWERNASGSFAMNICRKVSYHQNDECLVMCVSTCGGLPLCLPKPECD